MNLRRLFAFLVSLIITTVFLALALYRVNFAQLAQAFATADYRLVALATLLTLCGYWARTARWQKLLAPTKVIPIVRLFPVLVIGFALNNVLPGRPGEFARPYTLGKREAISRTLGFATVVLERIADGIALIAFLVLALGAFVPLGIDLPPVAEATALAATILFGVALTGLIFLLVREELALQIFQFFTRWLPAKIGARLEQMLGSFILGLHSLKSAHALGRVALLSLAVWLCEASAYFCILTAFGALPNVSDHVVAAVFMMVLINLGIMIPAAPGGLGPFEAAGVFALSAFGISETSAASVAIGSHTMQFLLITSLGLLFFWREGISLTQAREASDE